MGPLMSFCNSLMALLNEVLYRAVVILLHS
jgi:hypothetical protein